MRILDAGIGNIYMGDDAFGCEVVRALAARPLPDSVRVTDFGIRSYDLAYAIMDQNDVVILIDGQQLGLDFLPRVQPARKLARAQLAGFGQSPTRAMPKPSSKNSFATSQISTSKPRELT